MCNYIYIYIYTYLHICTYVSMHVCVYIYIYIYIFFFYTHIIYAACPSRILTLLDLRGVVKEAREREKRETEATEKAVELAAEHLVFKLLMFMWIFPLLENQDSSKGGAVETGCSDLYYIIH